MNNNNPTSREAYSRFFPSEANDSDQSTGYTNNNSNNNISGNNNSSSPTVVEKGINVNTTIGLQRNYGGLNHEGGNFGNIVSSPNSSMPSSSSSSPQLVRHSSSPAGLLNQLAHASGASNDDNGFPTNRTRNLSRLNTQLSFTRPQALTHISEEHENVDVDDLNQECDPRKTSHSHNVSSSYGLGAWEINPAGSVMISMGPSKRSDNITGDIVNNSLSAMESQQLQFSMLQPALVEMSSMDKLLNIPQDSVPCKIRAKRGFATHPRSIAERERRTRISGKLKKLQDLVPNMDKQTSYADMLDLAVQHIQGLQNQVQMLDKELEHCTCGCKKPQSAD